MGEADAATQRAARLLGEDKFAQANGISLVSARPGAITVRMTVRADHLNFLGWAHGAAVFAVADAAFGFASNSRENVSVGIDVHMVYLSGVREGDVIEAAATEISRTKRKAVYRVDVSRPADGTAVAAFTGTVYVTDKPLD